MADIPETSQLVEQIKALKVEKPPREEGIKMVAEMIKNPLKNQVASLNDAPELASFKKDYSESFKKVEAIYQALRAEKQKVVASTGKSLESIKETIRNEQYETGILTSFLLLNFPGRFENTRAFAQMIYNQFNQGKTQVDPALAKQYPGINVADVYMKSLDYLLAKRAIDSLDLSGYTKSESLALGRHFSYYYMQGVDTIEPSYMNHGAPGARSLKTLGISADPDTDKKYSFSTISTMYKNYKTKLEESTTKSFANIVNKTRNETISLTV